MYRVLHYKALNEAKLIQRMVIWKRYGCSLKEDPQVVAVTKGKAGALLYKNKKLVAVGFFESARVFDPDKPVKVASVNKPTPLKPVMPRNTGFESKIIINDF